uniref:Tyrosine-protein kinase receptor n=1 Tax=Haemonchus placei TaxID=6290 RepID=A0A158QK16_HAEPC
LSGIGISYVAVDDISLSVECFDKGMKGSQPFVQRYLETHMSDDSSLHFLSVDDQQQIWTVPETLLYRLIACGAEGGSFPHRVVENGGGCVIVDIKLIIGTKLHISIGQQGESPCDKHVKSSMVSFASMVYGAGGGGATTVSVDSAYIIVAAGGGGAYPSEYIEVYCCFREIGTGAFGTVHEGRTLDGQVYAVKTICMNKSTSAEAQREFAFEALFMHKFNHPNVVRLHWIQWDPPRLRIILEFMGGGDLRSFLREARPTQDNFNPYDLRVSDLINIALDIARGCEELNRQKYIHRDLAARNCLLTEKGPNRRVKIGDFGMARDIYENNYYRKGGRAKLPVRWMPPEAFLDGLFTTQTDVWSFGVVLWEISSFGMLPYFGVDNFDVMGLVTNGGRLDPPNTVPTEVSLRFGGIPRYPQYIFSHFMNLFFSSVWFSIIISVLTHSVLA